MKKNLQTMVTAVLLGASTTAFAQSGNITFADEEVKKICVKNFDTDADGELSYDEAAAVTDLKSFFYGNTSITKFNELVHFKGLAELSSVSIGYGYFKGTFEGCTALQEITLPEELTSIGGSAFSSTAITSITIPGNVTSIGADVFKGCSALAAVEVRGNVAKIDKNTFKDCRALINIALPESVTEIGDYAFYGCSSLNGIVLPSGLTKMGGNAFNGCTRLTTITIPENCKTFGFNSFAACEQLKEVIVLTKEYASALVNAFGVVDGRKTYFEHHVFGDYKTKTLPTRIPRFGEMLPCVKPAYEYTTFACDADVDFGGVSGLKAYVASHESGSNKVNLTEVTAVPAKTGLVIKATAGEVYKLALATGAVAPSANLLKGVVAKATVKAVDGENTNLILKDGAFLKLAADGVLAAGKAYLSVPTAELPVGAKAFDIVWDNTTGINTVESTQTKMENDAWYTLGGQRIAKPAKGGIYIHNGKKVIF